MTAQHRAAPVARKTTSNHRKIELAALIAGPVLCGLLGAAGSGKFGLAFPLIVAVVTACEVPSIVAYVRELDNRIQIYVLNVLTFWTVIGWVVAMVWACKHVPASEHPPWRPMHAPSYPSQFPPTRPQYAEDGPAEVFCGDRNLCARHYGHAGQHQSFDGQTWQATAFGYGLGYDSPYGGDAA